MSPGSCLIGLGPELLFSQALGSELADALGMLHTSRKNGTRDCCRTRSGYTAHT